LLSVHISADFICTLIGGWRARLAVHWMNSGLVSPGGLGCGNIGLLSVHISADYFCTLIGG